jgi:GT2 family glycosyltransferase
MPDVSFIIVSWNARDFLRTCLASIPAGCGSGLSAEVIVVDNDSADGSPDMVAAEFPEVVLVRERTNHGFAKGNNLGLQRAGGRYLALVNSDVKLDPDCAARLAAFMDAHPDVGLAGPRILNADRTLQRSCRRFPTLWRVLARTFALDELFPRLAYPPHVAGQVDVLSGCFWFARKAAVEKVGGLDDSFFMYSEDVDWCRRFADAGWGVVYVPQAEAVHYGGASSKNAPVRFYVEMCRAQLQYQRKHGGRLAGLVFGVLTFIHQLIRVVRGALLFLLKPAAREVAAYKIRRSLTCLKWLLRGVACGRLPGPDAVLEI